MIRILVFCLILLSYHPLFAQSPALIGYWQNWNSSNAPYIQLDQIDPRYNIIEVAFAVPQTGTDYKMQFTPDQVSVPVLISQIQNLQTQGKKVIISMGGATDPVSLDNIAERDTFVSTMNDIINTYGFDGIDIDFEGSSVSVSGGTISNPTDAKVINLINAIKQIMSDYYSSHGKRLLLTMAPETAFVQGGMSSYGGIWGAYLPVIHALRDSIEILQVQLYNSGSMYGIDGNIYSQGTADFVIAMTEAMIQGFNTSGGMFAGLPQEKIAVGLPACPNAAGGGYTLTADVFEAINYLRGNGVQPGTYTLDHAGGYPALRGMMTWSVNWDALSTCADEYEYAQTFENIFGTPTNISGVKAPAFVLYPNPSDKVLHISSSENNLQVVSIYNATGELVLSKNAGEKNITIDLTFLAKGIYNIVCDGHSQKFIHE